MGMLDFLKRWTSPPAQADDAPVMIGCSSCKQKFPMAEMQYDKSGQSLACMSCAGKALPPKPKLEEPKISSRQYVPQGYEQKTSFICTDCGYKFMRHAAYKASMRCPYCSTGNIRPHTPVQAQDMLDQVDNPERMFKY